MPQRTHRDAVIRTVGDAYMEVFPAAGIEDHLSCLPDNAYVAVTCSPKRGIGTTLELTERLVNSGFRVIPHVAARMVRERSHLEDILQRLDALRIDSVFVPAGDIAEPVGEYSASLEVLRDMAEIGHEFTDVGVAAHPEGHPLVDDATLLEALKAKQPYATYLVTQMCFDARQIIDWLRYIRSEGVTLPAWIGLPGAIERSKLVRTSLRIGVGESVRFVTKNIRLLGRFFGRRIYKPDDLLDDLAPYLDDPVCNIPGFHLFCFNLVESTEAWRLKKVASLRQPQAIR